MAIRTRGGRIAPVLAAVHRMEDASAREVRDGMLGEALRDLLTGWSECTGIAVEVWALPRGRMPAQIAGSVLVVVSGALSNVARHSGARTVSVAVTATPGELRLTVSDDGRGFAGPARGPGLAAVEASFAAVGGRLAVRSVPGEGTTVSGAVAL
ncbi:sensor histidine kinase [Planobispora siamensis]|uniref:Histidine kinase/HSP90-like ATPase domain-containing protein n=1 Tax=Planobispora siamensis TaxID=936338 RepID=A0A8J3SD06_9ACTN|nr:ATP-binding protein [Planobispora siamensis]GIH91868.1 hypothetical protein Psi01_24980 [Planobispora siamensis]